MTPPKCRSCGSQRLDGPHGERPVWFCGGCGASVDGNGTAVRAVERGPSPWVGTKALTKSSREVLRLVKSEGAR